MAYYQYYQSGGPWQNAWGTNAYQFQPPPMPNYMPQSSWRGLDFYNAHAGGGQDSSFFNYIWSKVNSRHGHHYDPYDPYPEDLYHGQVSSLITGAGVSRGEAEHWHRRVYSGIVQLHQLLPREIGAAAGWETLRQWQTHRSFYSTPLSGDQEREREAIIGLAIAEAARLWQFVGRPLDKYGRREAGEVAAATAGRIFIQMNGYSSPYDPYRSGRWGSDRLSDDEDFYPYHSSHHGRPRSLSNYGGSVYGGSAYDMTAPYGASLTVPMAVPGAGSVVGSPYGGYNTLSASPYQTAMSYPNNYMYGQPTLASSPGTVIIHSDSGRRRRSHSHSRRHHHHRSRSNSSVGFTPSAYSTGYYQ